jgi:O-antigen ligase
LEPIASLPPLDDGPRSADLPETTVFTKKDGLRPAYFALILFAFVYFMRPEDWIPGIAAIPLAKITGFLVIGAFMLGLVTNQVHGLPKFVKLMILFFFQLCVSVFFSIFRSGSLQIVTNFLNVVIITIVVVYVAESERRIKRLMFIQAVSIFAMSVLSVYRFKQGFALKGRMEGVLGGVFQNPNDFALNMAIVLPFCLAFLVQTPRILKKVAWLAAIGSLVYAILLTSSRGGFLATLTAMVVWVWQMSMKEGKKVWLLWAVVAVLGVAAAAPANYAQRLMSITDAEKDTTGSSQERGRLLERSVQISGQHPLFGVGPGNFQVVSGNWLVSHNAYAQLASEAGIPAFLIFCVILWDAFACIRRAQALSPPSDPLRPTIIALKASVTAVMTGAIFTNISYHYYPYFVFAYGTAVLAIVKQNQLVSASKVEEKHSSQNDPWGS